MSVYLKFLLGLVALPGFLSFAPAHAQMPDPATLAAVVQFNTMCSNCHEGECSGRMTFDSGSAAARGHIERHLGRPASETHIAALFAMLRHVKETCRHYPAVPIRPAAGSWHSAELEPWHNPQAGAYFIPLGKLPSGRQQIHLVFDGPADGHARIDTDRMDIVADERLCHDNTRTIELDAAGDIEHFLHMKSGKAMLRRIDFRRSGD
jgi:hypothetical protein